MKDKRTTLNPIKVRAFVTPCCIATIKLRGTNTTKAILPGTDTCKNAQEIIARIK